MAMLDAKEIPALKQLTLAEMAGMLLLLLLCKMPARRCDSQAWLCAERARGQAH
jgi:hypothetical protein